MKTKEELNVLKKEVETVNQKLNELTGEELAQISGGSITDSLKALQDRMKIDSGSSSDEYQIDESVRERIRQGINPYQKG